MKQLNIRMTEEERERVERLREWLQQRLGPHVKVSERTVIMEALDALEAKRARLEADRGRPR